MSRNENDNIDHLSLPDPIRTKANYYIKNGEIISREKFFETNWKKRPIVYAKEVQNIDTKISTYFVLSNNNGQMFDPSEIDPRYKSRNIWKFRRVKKTAFDLYAKFLKQHYKSFLRQAERYM